MTSWLKKTEPAKNEKKIEPPIQTAALNNPIKRSNPTTQRVNETGDALPSVVCIGLRGRGNFR